MKFRPELPPTRKIRSTPKWPLLLLGPALIYNALRWTGTGRPFFNLDDILLSVPSPEAARNWSAFYTNGSHFVGQGLKQAQWTQAKWEEFGISAEILSYDTELPDVTGIQRVALLQGEEVLYEAPLIDGEDAVEAQSFVHGYYGFSANGNITASYVYANFGYDEDFEALVRANISLVGKIAVMKTANVSPYLRERGINIFRGLQIANCEKRGLAGVLIYPDPQNDGPIADWNGYEPFPNGPARPPSMIERGTLGSIRDLEGGYVAKIPSIPISYADAIPILTALNGQGPLAKDLDERWHGGGLGSKGVNYNVGPSPEGLTLNIISHATINPAQVHNVVASIPGSVSSEVVILGNHRDAWGPGAGDPNSGSAALNEVVRSFGVALRNGWRPHRTLIFASWEGEELGQVGSIAWIRDNMPWLNATGVAYLNVVVAAGGSSFHVKASPLLYNAVHDATRRIQSPNQTVPGQTVFDVWDKHITTAGGGDAIWFQGAACISTVDMGFIPGLGDNPFPYHSGYDTHEWMDRYGDPGWHYHVATAKAWSLMAARLVENPVLGMKAFDYATALQEWLETLLDNESWPEFDASSLYGAVKRLAHVAEQFDAYAISLTTNQRSWWGFWSKCGLKSAIDAVNDKYMRVERAFYYEPGQDGNPPLRHVLYSPAAWYGDTPPFPGLADSLRSRNWTNAERWRDIITDTVEKAASLLEHGSK